MGPETSPNKPPVCENCQKSSQRELPRDDPLVAVEQQQGGGRHPCAPIYDRVEACMSEFRGQISPCSTVWQEFRECRDGHAAWRPAASR